MEGETGHDANALGLPLATDAMTIAPPQAADYLSTEVFVRRAAQVLPDHPAKRRKMAELNERKPEQGFEGSFSNLLLADVIQIEGQNRFSGCVSIASGPRTGRLFFQAGEIIHAETADARGEVALVEMIGWPEGRFSIEKNVATVSRTVEKNLGHLLLDVHLALDKKRMADKNADPGPARKSRSQEKPPMTVAERVRQLPDVSYAVLVSKEGVPVDDLSEQAEALAAKGCYAASMVGVPVGTSFGVGGLQVLALHSSREQLLIYQAEEQFFCVSVFPGASLDATEAAIREILAPGAP